MNILYSSIDYCVYSANEKYVFSRKMWMMKIVTDFERYFVNTYIKYYDIIIVLGQILTWMGMYNIFIVLRQCGIIVPYEYHKCSRP